MERFKQFTWLCDSGTKLDELFYRSAGALRIQQREFQPPMISCGNVFFLTIEKSTNPEKIVIVWFIFQHSDLQWVEWA